MKSFTDKYIQSLKPELKEYRVREGKGFAIRVLPTGLKRFEFIYTINKRKRIMHLGNYPDTKLTEARTAFYAAASLLRDKKIDPQSVPASETVKAEASEITVVDLVNKWIGWSEEHHSKKWSNTLKLTLQKDFLPEYGNRLASDIKRSDASNILKEKAKTAPGQARNLHKALRGTWEYGVDEEFVDYNPFAELKTTKKIPAMKQVARKRILSDDEIVALWSLIDEGGGSDSTRRALKLILITGQRGNEICGIHSREIQPGIGKEFCKTCRRCGWLTIPEERRQGNKGGEHLVFLPYFAMQLIDAAGVVSDGYIFPGDTSDKAITENAVAYHVRREVTGTGKTPYYGLLRWTPHDMRRTAGTGVRRLGASRDTMDLILGHSVGGVTGVYDRYDGNSEKEVWLEKWSEHLTQLLKTAAK